LFGQALADLPQFSRTDEQARVKAVITLGTPHKGPTLTDVAEVDKKALPVQWPFQLHSQKFLENDPQMMNIIVDFITSCSFADRRERIYDLGLDHWGFHRLGTETYQDMRERIAPAVRAWWHSKVNGIYDNSIFGVTALNTLAAASQPLPPSNLLLHHGFLRHDPISQSDPLP
jgi:hypothetical protein